MTKLYAIYARLVWDKGGPLLTNVFEEVTIEDIKDLNADLDVCDLKVIEGALYPKQSIDKLTS